MTLNKNRPSLAFGICVKYASAAFLKLCSAQPLVLLKTIPIPNAHKKFKKKKYFFTKKGKKVFDVVFPEI